MKNVVAIIMAGGHGKRLYPLTRERSKPSVPFGGIYRIIDIVLSNCVNSEIYKIMTFLQYRAQSLVDHIEAGWNIFNHSLGHFLKIVHPKLAGANDFYKGTADSVRHNINLLDIDHSDYVIILSGDHIYKMDYRILKDFHVDHKADCTLVVKEIDLLEAHRFGVVQVNKNCQITDIKEKPENPYPMPSNPHKAIISMGIYIFNRQFLTDLLLQSEGDDFGHDILPLAIKNGRVCAYNFDEYNKISDFVWEPLSDGSRAQRLVEHTPDSNYWMDVGNIEAYWQANMDLTGVTPNFNLYGIRWPIHTYQQQYPPVKTVFNNEKENRVGTILDSIVSPGSIISGGSVVNSVLSYGVRINSWTTVENSVLFSNVHIGRNCKIKNTIIDKHNFIPAETIIGFDSKEDKKRFFISEGGLVVIPKNEFPPPN